MTSTLFLIFILIFPIFGKSLDFTESVFFYGFSLIFFFYFLHKKKFLFFEKKFIPILIILTILLFFSTITSKIIGLSYYQFFVYLDIILLFTFSVATINPKKIKIGLIIASIIYCLIFLLNKIGFLPLAIKPFSDNFILQIWGHSYLADFIIFSIPILICYIAEEKEKKRIYLLILVLSIILLSLFLTNSRSALLSTILGICFLKTKNISFKKILIATLASVLIFVSILTATNKPQNKSLWGDRGKYFQNAIVAFCDSPFLGNGLRSFFYINDKYKLDTSANTSFSHNSLIAFLSQNGIIFTLFFFGLVFVGIKNNYKKDNLFFVLSVIAVFHSFLDPTWESPGIFLIGLYFIFFYSIRKQNINQNQKLSKTFFWIYSIIILLFFISKTISDIFFLRNQLQLSLIFDPFNLNSRIAIIKNENPNSKIWQNNLNFSLFFFKNNSLLYEALIKKLPFPENENYYFRFFDLNPKTSFQYYIELTNSYNSTNENKKTETIINQLDNESVIKMNYQKRIALSKIYYNYAIHVFKTDPQNSLKYFEKTVLLVPALGHFQIDLANAYWYTDQKEKAVIQLEKCLEYPEPKKHCQQYLDEHQNKEFEKPGQNDFINHVNNELK